MDGRGTPTLRSLTLGLVCFAAADAAAQVNNKIYIPYPTEAAVRAIDPYWSSEASFTSGMTPSCVVPALDGRGSYIVVPSASAIYRDQ